MYFIICLLNKFLKFITQINKKGYLLQLYYVLNFTYFKIPSHLQTSKFSVQFVPQKKELFSRKTKKVKKDQRGESTASAVTPKCFQLERNKK